MDLEKLKSIPQIDIQREYQEFENNLSKKLTQLREDYILESLRNYGYTFENKSDLENFAKTKCVIGKYHNGSRVLRVQGKIICKWTEPFGFDDNGNLNPTFTHTEPDHTE